MLQLTMLEGEKMTRVKCDAEHCEFNNHGVCGMSEIEITTTVFKGGCQSFQWRGRVEANI